MSVKLVLIVVLVVVLVGAGLWIGYTLGKPSSPHDTVVVDGGLVDQIVQISELATVNYHTAAYEVREHRSDKWYPWADANFDVYLFWQGSVKAGVDLDSTLIHIESHPDSGKHGIIAITLPQAKILSVEPDSAGFMFFINWVSTFGSAPPDRQKADWANELVPQLRKAATKNGILAQATKNAKVALEGYVGLLGYDVRFVDKKGN